LTKNNDTPKKAEGGAKLLADKTIAPVNS